MENFRFFKLSATHKRRFLLYQTALFSTIGGLAFLGIKLTNPVLTTATDKMSVTSGVIVGVLVGVLAYANRLKGLLKVKFIAFAIVWVLLLSFQAILPTLLYTIGLILPALMVDDMIMLPYWRNLWYNEYES